VSASLPLPALLHPCPRPRPRPPFRLVSLS